KVIELGYRRIYYREREQKLVPVTEKDGLTPGWYPAPDAKRLLLEEYRTALAMKRVINRSQLALEECLRFEYTASGRVEHGGLSGGDDPSGARENHGDRVIADGLAYKMVRKLGRSAQAIQEEKAPIGSWAWRRELHKWQERQREQEKFI